MARCAWRVGVNTGDMRGSDHRACNRRSLARNAEYRVRATARDLGEQSKGVDKSSGAARPFEMRARNFIFGVA